MSLPVFIHPIPTDLYPCVLPIFPFASVPRFLLNLRENFFDRLVLIMLTADYNNFFSPVFRFLHFRYSCFYLSGYLLKILSLAIFRLLIFEFIHSELDLIKHDEDNHSTHDYCSLVEGVSLNNFIQKTVDIKKLLYSVFNTVIPQNYTIDTCCNYSNDFNRYIKKTSTSIFIINKSLLI